MLAVAHALKPSSSTHSLQIYCTGLAGPRSHTSWAWAAKHDPTKKKKIYIYIYILCPYFHVPYIEVRGPQTEVVIHF